MAGTLLTRVEKVDGKLVGTTKGGKCVAIELEGEEPLSKILSFGVHFDYTPKRPSVSAQKLDEVTAGLINGLSSDTYIRFGEVKKIFAGESLIMCLSYNLYTKVE